MMRNINVGDAVKFYNDCNIYEVSGIITDQQRVFYYDPFNEAECEKQFEEVVAIFKEANDEED
jgi:predicted RNA-binding protein with PUA-like domain